MFINDNTKGNFSDVMDIGMTVKGWKCTDLHEQFTLEEKKLVSLRALQRYHQGIHVPDPDKAKIILSYLPIEITDEEITDLIDFSRSVKVEFTSYSNARYLTRHVKLRIRNLSLLSDDDAHILVKLKERIRDTQENNTFSAYVSDLIQRDIDFHILPRKDEKE